MEEHGFCVFSELSSQTSFRNSTNSDWDSQKTKGLISYFEADQFRIFHKKLGLERRDMFMRGCLHRLDFTSIANFSSWLSSFMKESMRNLYSVLTIFSKVE